MSAGHRKPHWLYDKAQRQIKRREDLADYERDYRREAGLPEGPLDLVDHVCLELALKTFELFMDRVFWGEGSGEMTGLLGATKLATYDLRPPMPRDPYWMAFYDEALAWFEDVLFQPEYRGTSPLAHAMAQHGIYADPSQDVPRLSRETMDLLASSLDKTLEYYGTSEHADPRGYWMPVDGRTS